MDDFDEKIKKQKLHLEWKAKHHELRMNREKVITERRNKHMEAKKAKLPEKLAKQAAEVQEYLAKLKK